MSNEYTRQAGLFRTVIQRRPDGMLRITVYRAKDGKQLSTRLYVPMVLPNGWIDFQPVKES